MKVDGDVMFLLFVTFSSMAARVVAGFLQYRPTLWRHLRRLLHRRVRCEVHVWKHGIPLHVFDVDLHGQNVGYGL